MLGSLPLEVRSGKFYEVFGGPFRDCPKNMVGLKLAVEIDAPCDYSLPIPDFQTPRVKEAQSALRFAVRKIALGQPLYVGCMGGRGRTGLFMALLAKTFGIPDPVAYVRREYFAHAVETTQQHRFVSSFPVPLDVRLMVRFLRFVTFFRGNGCLTYTSKTKWAA